MLEVGIELLELYDQFEHQIIHIVLILFLVIIPDEQQLLQLNEQLYQNQIDILLYG